MSEAKQGSLALTSVVPSTQRFPVVGIGASAGGLQALRSFFEAMPDKSGMAFVVVMHLSPTHESNAAAILQRSTGMPVREVTQPILVEPNSVYVISPTQHLEMNDGYLRVHDRPAVRGRPIAVDLLFKTMALAHRSRSFGIILSGTGNDGAHGLSMIKDQGGIVLVQAVEQAEHGGMPQAAIATGMTDFVLPVEQMPDKLQALWRNAQQISLPAVDRDEADDAPSADQEAETILREIINTLRVRTGHDFAKYKRATLLRRIERRMQVNQVATLAEYRNLLRDARPESEALLNDMLIGVTQFFRDPDAFASLEKEIIPRLVEQRAEGDPLRVWSVACSTGEEAYSLAMLLAEQVGKGEQAVDFQVFASDIDERSIAVARSGSYPNTIVEDVPAPRLAEHFVKEDGCFRVKKALREKVLFAIQNLLRDPPFSRLDLISCRNLLIYLNRETHAEVLALFHFALKPDGYLFLGSSESADAVSELFEPVDKKNRIYRAKPQSRFNRPAIPMSVAPVAGTRIARSDGSDEQQKPSYANVHQRVLAEYAPPSVLVDQHGNIVHMSEGLGQFLRHIAGEPSRNLTALVVPELRLELRTALFQATKSGKSVETRRMKVERGEHVYFVNITARPFYDSHTSTDFVLVLFYKVEQTTDERVIDHDGVEKDVVLSGLEEELQRARSQLQETIEQSETSTEELKASNEELQAINEELRSATEELETSKEELQSVNEELITVNQELKAKVEETNKVNDDLQNLIASTDLATIFVDRGMRIKGFTPHASELFNLIPGDVGRPLNDINHKLDYPELTQDAIAAFETLRAVEREVASNDQRWFIARLLPYRTGQDRIDGAVLTFIDITGRHLAEQRARLGEERMRLVADSTKDYAIITTDSEGRITSFNKGAERMFGYSEQELLGQPDSMLFTPEDKEAEVPQQEKHRAREEGRAEDERWHMRKDGSRVFCSGVITPMMDGEFHGYAKISRDLTQRLEQEQRQAERLEDEQSQRAEAQSANAMKDEFLAVMSHELKHPLNLIHMNAELLLRQPQVYGSVQLGKAVNAIRSSAVSQAKIIADLLDLSRLKTGKLDLTLEDLDLSMLVQGIVAMHRDDPGAADLTITVEPAPPLVVHADRVRLEQVVWNLLSNAIKFTPSGGSVRCALARDGGYARLDVCDSGEGIAGLSLATIFDMFGQGAPSHLRGTKGLGIGLALVRQIVELHGGRVEARSEGLGQGACFSAWLPMTEHGLHGEDRRQQGDQQALHGVRVLVLEDSSDALELLVMLLEMAGATVHGCERGQQALDVLAQQPVDLIISDLAMPEMDGLTFIKAVRARPDSREVPAIAITGFGRARDIEEARQAGFNAHLDKPVDVDKLVQCIRHLLAQAG